MMQLFQKPHLVDLMLIREHRLNIYLNSTELFFFKKNINFKVNLTELLQFNQKLG